MTRDYAPMDPERGFGEAFAAMQQRLYDMERLLSSASAGVPAGEIRATIAATAPAGWLICTGQALASADALYPALWSVAPAAWKSGTTLTLPDLRGRTLFGAGGGVYTTLGTAAGANSKTISAANLPPHSHDLANHTHSGTTGGFSTNHFHQESANNGNDGWLKRGAYNGLQWDASFTNNGLKSVTFHSPYAGTDWGSHDHTHNFGTGGPSSNASGNGPGSSAALDVSPAALPVNWLIKAH